MKALPPELREQLDRVREYVDDDEITALFKRIADRYDVAKASDETGEATIRLKFHRGAHGEFRWNADERVRG